MKQTIEKMGLQTIVSTTCVRMCLLTTQSFLHIVVVSPLQQGGSGFFSRDVVLGGKLLLWGEKM